MTDVLETLALLPEVCASYLLGTGDPGEPILIRRGVKGYYPSPGVDVERFNKRKGITLAQKEAMDVGSHFGWEVPGADPRNYEGPEGG